MATKIISYWGDSYFDHVIMITTVPINGCCYRKWMNVNEGTEGALTYCNSDNQGPTPAATEVLLQETLLQVVWETLGARVCWCRPCPDPLTPPLNQSPPWSDLDDLCLCATCSYTCFSLARNKPRIKFNIQNYTEFIRPNPYHRYFP